MLDILIQKGPPPQNTYSNSNIPFKFFDLPLELRNEIYAHLFVQAQPIQCSRVWVTTAARHLRQLMREKAPDCCGTDYGCVHYDSRLRPLTGILRTCRQASEEALRVLYVRNVFRLDLESRSTFLRFFTVGRANLRRIRHLQIVASTAYYSYAIARPGEEQWRFFRPAAEDAGCWTALVGGLAALECVLKVPIWGHHSGWPVWVAQLETVLGFVGEHVDAQTEVTVDDNYSMFLCEAVDRCFVKGCRRVRTLEGNAYYYKTRFDPGNITGPVASDM